MLDTVFIRYICNKIKTNKTTCKIEKYQNNKSIKKKLDAWAVVLLPEMRKK